MKKPEIKKGDYLSYLKWFWWFIWDDNSIYSWIANVVVAFVLIKFIVYPLLGLIFTTTHPIVAVVSGSMEHKIADECVSYDINGLCAMSAKAICGKTYQEKASLNLQEYWRECGQWYEKRNITFDEFSSYDMKNGFNKGDIILLKGKNSKDLKRGDIIVFQSPFHPEPIIHRIVAINVSDGKRFFTTKGDHNGESGPVDVRIDESKVIGKAYLKIPYMGYIKIWFMEMVYFLRDLVLG